MRRDRHCARWSSSSANRSWSSTWTRPADGTSSPAISPSCVDFPEPDAPTTATVSPASTANPTSCRIGSQPYASRTRLSRCSTIIAGMRNGMIEAMTGGANVHAPARLTRQIELGMRLFALSVFLLAALFGHVLAARADNRPVLLVLGDSLSAEYGLARGTGWVALLERRLADQGLRYRVVNASISGDTTSGGAARLPGLLEQHRPRVVIIELGGNDALRGLQLQASLDNLTRMIDDAQAVGARVLVLGMQVPPNYGRRYAERFASVFRLAAESRQAALVPFFLEGFGDRLDLFQPDRIHPNGQAQPLMLDNVWPALRPLLDTGRS
ncbi:MAG: arylesterase [Burkholderiales bacterium]|nr:MAG: arylesterase [Burkholderiales bacterium]